jgi:PAS domain S-box-containing protein
MSPFGSLLDNSIFRQVFESASDMVILTDPAGAIVQLNRAGAAAFPRESSLGVPFWIRLGLDEGSLPEILERHGSLKALVDSAERRILPETGRRVHDLSLVPLGSDGAAGEGYLLILKDVTARIDHRTELERRVADRTRSLDRSRKMLQSVFQGVGKGIVLVDEDREVVETNQKACEIFGLQPVNILGMRIHAFCAEGDRDRVQRIMETLLEGQVASAEVEGLYVDRRVFPAVFTFSLIVVDGARLWTVIVDDVTEQKRLERQLETEKNLTEEANITLRNVLRNIENEQRELVTRLSRVVAGDILPALDKLKAGLPDEIQAGCVDYIEDLLVSLTQGSEAELDAGLLHLSRTEIRICKLIKAGFSTKDICGMMNLAFDTIQTHRKNIRRKLGLAGSGRTSLYGHLATRRL